MSQGWRKKSRLFRRESLIKNGFKSVVWEVGQVLTDAMLQAAELGLKENYAFLEAFSIEGRKCW